MIDLLIALTVLVVPVAAVAVLVWTLIIRWWRALEAAGAMDTLRPTSDEVADLEAELPELRDRTTDPDILAHQGSSK
jgi:hypothetical protein